MHAEALLKRGRFLNQLTRFRYDVVLHVGASAPEFGQAVWANWRPGKHGLSHLRHTLSDERPEVLALRSISNARLDRERAAVSWLRSASDAATVSDLRAHLSTVPETGVEPDRLADLAEELGYRAELSWLNCDSGGRFDAVLTRADCPALASSFTVSVSPASGGRTGSQGVFWPAFANRTHREKAIGNLAGELRVFLGGSLPAYMVPAAFNVLDALPLSPNGKIDRKALSRMPVTFQAADDEADTVVLSPLEKCLTEAWAETLHLGRVGPGDNFYELGGDSLRAVALTHKLQRALRISVRPAALLAAPTVRQFAQVLEDMEPGIGYRLERASTQSGATSPNPEEAAADTAIVPVSFAQRRFWTLQRQNPDVPFYNTPFAFRLKGQLDRNILRRSLDAVVNRHESMRTTLQERDGELVQVISPSGSMKIREESVRHLKPGERPAGIDRLLREEMLLPFRHATEAGVRVLLVDTDQDDCLLQFTLHNTLFDAASLLVLLDEFSHCYTAFAKGEALELAAPTDFREYVRWQADLLTTGFAERRAYWHKWLLPGDPPKLAWDGANPAPAVPDFAACSPWFQVSPEQSDQLRELSRSRGVTFYIALLAAYAVFLKRCHGCSDVAFGTTYSNRNRWDLSALIGASIDVPALRVDLSDNPPFSVLLGRMRDAVSDALTYQDVPYELVSPHLELGRTTPVAPLTRAMLAYFPEMPTVG